VIKVAFSTDLFTLYPTERLKTTWNFEAEGTTGKG